MREAQQLGDGTAIKDLGIGELRHWQYPTDQISKSNLVSGYRRWLGHYDGLR